MERAPGARSAAGQPLHRESGRGRRWNVLQPFAPDEAVVPVTVPKILVHVPLVRLRFVVAAVAVSGLGGEQGGTLVEVERDNCSATGWRNSGTCRREKIPCRRPRRPPLDRPVDGVHIERLAIARGAVSPDVMDAGEIFRRPFGGRTGGSGMRHRKEDSQSVSARQSKPETQTPGGGSRRRALLRTFRSPPADRGGCRAHPAVEHDDAVDVLEHKRGDIGGVLGLHVIEVGIGDVVQEERRSCSSLA